MRLDPSPAGVLFCCWFCSGKFQSPRTVYICSPPLLSSLTSEFFCLLPRIRLLPLLNNAVIQISPVITEFGNIFGDQRLFSVTFHLKYLTGCINHRCIVGGGHTVDVHVLIPRNDELCEFPTYCSFESACNIWVPQLLKVKP